MTFLFVAIFFCTTFAISAGPPDQDIKPCICSEIGCEESYITCENITVDRMQEALETIVNTQKSIHLELKSIKLFNLTSSFLVGLDLTSLSVEHCNLSSVDDNAFDDDVADKLEELSLSYNALERVPSSALKKLSSLRTLRLDYNKLELLHAEAFEGPRVLFRLSLKGNKIKSIDDSVFVGIEIWLQELILDENELTAIPTQQLKNHFNLWILQLNNNRISTLQPEGLHASFGKSLLRLGLANNSIRQLPPRAFVSQRGLRSLDLSGNALESVDASAFQGIEDFLSDLDLGNNLLNEVPAASLKNLSRLEYLDLSGNHISTVRTYDFSTLESIEGISLANNS